MYYYAVCLRTASFAVVNSTWTKNHIDSILGHWDLVFDFLHMLPPLLFVKFLAPNRSLKSARIVYPPCATLEISSFDLTNRQRVILSVAQFRQVDHSCTTARLTLSNPVV